MRWFHAVKRDRFRMFPVLSLAIGLHSAAAFTSVWGDPAAASHLLPFLVPSACPPTYTWYPDIDGVCNQTILRNLAEVKPRQSIAVIQLEQLSTPHSIGYYPHAFSELVGPRGHVYVITTSVTSDMGDGGSIKGRAITGDYVDANVSKVMAPMPLTSFPALPKLDVVWAAQGVYSYFDLLRPFEHESLMPPFQSAMFKPVFDALRPGGLFLLMGEDSEVICFQKHPDCGLRHARQINGVPYRGMLELIEQAGFRLELGLTALRDTKPRPQHNIWPGHMELGFNPTSFPIEYPFLWKLRRLDR